MGKQHLFHAAAPVKSSTSTPSAAKRPAVAAETVTEPKHAKKQKVSDIDDIFGKAKAARKIPVVAQVAKKEEEPIRVLLPGQKKPKGKRLAPEFVPVDKPRRFEDGLPVYKSYDDFTDMAAGQQIPKDAKDKGGACPFDCWCCF